MPDTTETTSDYSGSLSPTSSEEEEEEEKEEQVKITENCALLWSGSGAKKIPLIMFRPESLITKDKKLKSIGEKYHLAYKMVKTESKLVRSVLGAYGFHEVHPNSADFNLMWTGAHLKPFSLRSLQDFQKVNHFPRSYEITRKDRLYKNIERMAHTKGTKHFDFIPKSYLMPSEYQDFCAAYMKEKGSWIVKPIASSRGRGIYLINNPNQVPLEDNIMVCKYINNPLLIDGFKFDVRVYVAITSYDPLLIYLYEEGLTRFATVKYERANKHLKNQMMHLTNYSINKKSHDYVRCEDPEVEDYGNKWSMSAMLRYLKQEGIDTATLMARIEGVIIKSIIAAELPIATACKMFVPHKENCIELYGFDILIDENLKPWILEGNLSPSLACDAPLDLKIKSSMVADFFSIAGFRCIDPMSRRQNKKQMDLLQRPYSAQRSASSAGTTNRNNKRPSSAGYKDAPIPSAKHGLSAEENKVLTMAKEQYQRRGNFVRIFPTVETWELYGSFLEYKSNLNYILATKLFPERSKSYHGTYSTAVARIRGISSSQMLESRHHLIAERFIQYERKLFTLEAHRKRRVPSAGTKKQRNRDTPIGIDRKSKKRASQPSKGESSSEEESEEDEEESDEDADDDEKSETKQDKSGKRSGKTRSSLSSGDVAVKPKKSLGKTDLPHPSSKSSSAIRSDASSESVSSNSTRKATQPAKQSDPRSPKSVSTASAKSVPVQRVYMYKSSNSADTGSLSSEKSNTVSVQSEMNKRSNSLDRKSTSGTSNHSDTKKSDSSQSKQNGGRNMKYVNVLAVLKAGGNLGKLQARQAFSAYLSRVQHRLRMESEGHVTETSEGVQKQEEQMDLVLRFLKRAAGNLCQSFSVVVPSRRLAIIDRKRILSKQLGEFVRIYNKESDAIEQKQNLGLDKEAGGSDKRSQGAVPSVTDFDFRTFLSSASESALEEVLTAYTHKNKSASVFLGASKAKNTQRLYEKDSAGNDKSSNHVIGQSSYNVTSASTNRMNSSHYAHGDDPKEKSPHSNMSSIQQASYIYSTKSSGYHQSNNQKRPSSARPMISNSGTYYGSNTPMRPVSASNRPFGSSIHYQSAANQEAISDALQRLTERQAARQYSASVQLTALSKHLSNLNLANMNGSTQHRHTGPTEYQLNGSPQRTSSLCNLASSDPSIQSMVDPSGMQKLNFGNNSDSLPHDGTDHSGFHGSNDSIYKSQQVLSQQSSSLLQQSKAKHQAMLAQMLEVWRARQQEEMRLASYSGSSYLYPSSSTREIDCSSPYQGYSSYSRRESRKGDARTDMSERYGRTLRIADDRNLKDSILLKRTERLINSPGRDARKSSLKRSFMDEVFQSTRNLSTVSGSDDISHKSAIYRSTDSCKSKLTKIKPRRVIETKPSKLSPSGKTDLKSNALNSRRKSMASHFSTPSLHHEVCSHSILREIHSMFEKGELPSKRWTDKYKNRRKIN